mgnify:CR=1 FL=1|tara:strand:- start:5300 stop:5572 length:273 start_codon:yes stop_codon:yes gene_type:complete
MKCIRILVLTLTLTSCVVTVTWDSNRELKDISIPPDQPVLEEEKAPNPVPGTPYKVPPLPIGAGMSKPNPLLPVWEYSLTSAPKAIPVSY